MIRRATPVAIFQSDGAISKCPPGVARLVASVTSSLMSSWIFDFGFKRVAVVVAVDVGAAAAAAAAAAVSCL